MEILLVIILGLIAVVINFLIENGTTILIVGGAAIAIAIIWWCVHLNRLSRAQWAEKISETPIIERVSEQVGHTTSYGRYLSYHEHYQDRDIITGYKIKFFVVFEDGSEGYITCKAGGAEYIRLANKIKK